MHGAIHQAKGCGKIDAAAVCCLQLGLLFAVSKNVISFYWNKLLICVLI